MCEGVSEDQQLGVFFVDWALVCNFHEHCEDVFVVTAIVLDEQRRKYSTHEKAPFACPATPRQKLFIRLPNKSENPFPVPHERRRRKSPAGWTNGDDSYIPVGISVAADRVGDRVPRVSGCD
jgi:hypothetical protein